MGHHGRRFYPTWHRACGARRIAMPLAAVALCLMMSLPALAAARAQGTYLRATAAPAGHVTVIVLDMSGSMAQNDPNSLRCSAANAYIDLSGPGDYVGVVGLDAGSSTGNDGQGFPATVDWGLAPRELSTVAARQALRSAIAQKSHNCAPDGNTPTFDALARAEAMLAQATQTGMSGSVILLTDGIPAPNPDGQVSAIQKTLLAQFKARNWPIDTIALGSDQSFRGFLGGLSSATSGSFYDDGHGVVPGVSPLNITPFFIQIFRVRNGRSPGPDITPTALEAGVTARNFSVGAYVSHLDIVVVKDDPNTAVSVVAPGGQRFPPAAAGTFVSTDPHYAIFAVDAPQPGAWEVDLSGGGGQFLMDSLKVSTLALDLVSPPDGGVLALGEPFTLSASLSTQGAPISGGRFSLSGHVEFSGGGGSYVQDVQLSDPNGTGVYSAAVTVPSSAPSGSYAVTVTAHSASEDVIAAQRVLRFELFPMPVIYAPGTTTPAVGTISASAVAWDPLLSLLYRVPGVSALGGWALDGHTAHPSVILHGQVQLKGQPYGDASVAGIVAAPQQAAVHPGGQKTSAPAIAVVRGDNATFQLVFPADASGSYALDLTTAGAFAQTHGDLTHVTRTARVTVAPATVAEELRAWAITLFYLCVLLLLFLLVRYGFAQKPFGELAGGDGGQEFARARRAPWTAMVFPGRVTSRQMGLDSGLVFLFRRGGRILVRGVAGSRHFELAGRPVPAHPVPAAEAELCYDDGDETLRYVIRSRASGDGLEEDEASARPRGVIGRLRGPRPDEDDADPYGDDGGRPRRGLAAGLLAGRRGRSRDDADDDGDWDAPPVRRARGRPARDEDDEVYSGRMHRVSSRASSARRRDEDDDDDPRRGHGSSRPSSRSRHDDGDDGKRASRNAPVTPRSARRGGRGRSSGDDDDDAYTGSRRTVRRRRSYEDDD